MPLNFDEPCNVEHITCLMDNLSYARAHGDKEAIECFRSLLEQTEKQCGSIRRALNGLRSPTPKSPQRKIAGFGRGFAGMLDEYFGNEEPKKVERAIHGFGDGFIGMLDQAFKRVERQAKAPVVIAEIPHPAIIDPLYDFPMFCNKSCKHVQCSSWGTDEMRGKLCRNRTPTNEEISRRHVTTTQIRTFFGGIER